MPRGGVAVDIRGQRFGRLTAVCPRRLGKVFAWLFRCDCGEERVIRYSHVKNGSYVSCGCARTDVIRRVATRHGASRVGRKTPTYVAWCSMLKRCRRESPGDGPNYVARGIRVAPEWEVSFEAFLAHIGERPGVGHSVDRIDGNGHYEPGNVRWATNRIQSRNKRTNVWVELGGRKRLLCDLAEAYNVNYHTLYNRVFSYGWSIDRAVSEPVATQRRAKRCEQRHKTTYSRTSGPKA